MDHFDAYKISAREETEHLDFESRRFPDFIPVEIRSPEKQIFRILCHFCPRSVGNIVRRCSPCLSTFARTYVFNYAGKGGLRRKLLPWK